MMIYLGADHRGYELKQEIAAYLAKRNYPVDDLGNEVFDKKDDFTDFAAKVAVAIIGSDDEEPRGILLCGGGQGMAMAANRFNGIRAVVVDSVESARTSRAENDANVLCLSADSYKDDDGWKEIIDIWLTTKFSAKKRYERRNKKLDNLS